MIVIKVKYYYLLIVTTMYDGLEFTSNLAIERDKVVIQKQAEKEAKKNILHENTGEILDRVELIEITKQEYEVLRKFHI